MLPAKLKKMNLFQNGASFLGEAKEVTLPKLERKMEGYRAGAMTGEVELDMGHETLVLEFTLGGLLPAIFRQWGQRRVDAVQLRFVGSYQNEETGGVDSVEVVMFGRHKVIDLGGAATGGETEHKVTSTLSHYELIINGREEIYIDVLRGIERVNGVDLTAAERRAIGLL